MNSIAKKIEPSKIEPSNEEIKVQNYLINDEIQKLEDKIISIFVSEKTCNDELKKSIKSDISDIITKLEKFIDLIE